MLCKYLENIRICCPVKPTTAFLKNLCILQNYALNKLRHKKYRVESNPSKCFNQSINKNNNNPIKNTNVVHSCWYLHLAPQSTLCSPKAWGLCFLLVDTGFRGHLILKRTFSLILKVWIIQSIVFFIYSLFQYRGNVSAASSSALAATTYGLS